MEFENDDACGLVAKKELLNVSFSRVDFLKQKKTQLFKRLVKYSFLFISRFYSHDR